VPSFGEEIPQTPPLGRGEKLGIKKLGKGMRMRMRIIITVLYDYIFVKQA